MGEPTADGRERDWRAGTEVGSEGGGGGSLADLELALDGVGGLEDSAGGLLPQHVPPGLPALGGPEARYLAAFILLWKLNNELVLFSWNVIGGDIIRYLKSGALLIARTIAALLASEYAKGNYKQARLVLYRVLQIGGVTGLALAATLFLGFGYLTLLFTDDPAL
ncbi:hypothetical protein ZWY2020_008776 [Hordeum vulgare]|nr:hypothetical protein ZWY2020_008776 [Hordeum vulgare]